MNNPPVENVVKENTVTLIPTKVSIETKTSIPVTNTSIAVSTISVTATPILGIGSTMISEKDGMVMAFVPAGEFVMGSDADNAVNACTKYSSYCPRSRFVDAEPPHEVNLNAFWIDLTEVTNGMYAKCVAAKQCTPLGISFTRSSYFGNSEFDNFPVVYVNWYDANAYCAWVGRRLPSEGEWEKAARGIDERFYPWAKGISCFQANYRNNFKDCIGDTIEVGNYEDGKSPYGLYDMAGNVSEWVNDWYSDTYYQVSPLVNPTGPSSGQYRVSRGGGWHSDAASLTTIEREYYEPMSYTVESGFRCAMDVTP